VLNAFVIWRSATLTVQPIENVERCPLFIFATDASTANRLAIGRNLNGRIGRFRAASFEWRDSDLQLFNHLREKVFSCRKSVGEFPAWTIGRGLFPASA
jgi:hypothetical protein